MPAVIRRALPAALAALMLVPAVAIGAHRSEWAPAQKIDEIDRNSSELNTPFIDGCPIQSPDGRSLFIASNRPRFAGDTRSDLDIWVARRSSRHAPWGPPVNLGAPVNTTSDDFCPTPIDDGGLFFVSRKTTAESCGMGDVYFTQFHHRRGWSEPTHLACAPAGPNSALDEQGPSYVSAGRGAQLYFSSSSATVPGDIYVSERLPGRDSMSFGPAQPVVELNSPANDIQPNVRADGREVVFSSNRPGGLGAQDIWVATRRNSRHAWSTPSNIGEAVNGHAAETRPSLSRDGRTLLFGRAPGPEGASDVYITTRGHDAHSDESDSDG